MSINQDSTILYIIETRQQARNSTLARASWTNNCYHLARLNLQMQTMQDRLLRVIAEDDCAKLDSPDNLWHFFCVRLILKLNWHTENLVDTLSRNTCTLQLRVLLA